MITLDREYVTSRYKLQKLKEIEDLVADGKYLANSVFSVHGPFFFCPCPKLIERLLSTRADRWRLMSFSCRGQCPFQ
jgi:hypothetical protein